MNTTHSTGEAGLSPEQRLQIDYIYQAALERDRRREEWLSTLLRLEALYASIAVPLSLAGGIQGIGGAMTAASLLFSVLAILSGAVRLHAPVRTASRNADQVREDSMSFRMQRPATTPFSRFEKACEVAMQVLSLLSVLLLLAAVCCSSFPCLKSLLHFKS